MKVLGKKIGKKNTLRAVKIEDAPLVWFKVGIGIGPQSKEFLVNATYFEHNGGMVYFFFKKGFEKKLVACFKYHVYIIRIEKNEKISDLPADCGKVDGQKF